MVKKLDAIKIFDIAESDNTGLLLSLLSLSLGDDIDLLVAAWEEYSYGVEAFRPESLYAPDFLSCVSLLVLYT